MTTLAWLILKVTVVLGAGLLLAWCLRRRSAAVRHVVLVTAVLGALVMPLASMIAPSWGPAVQASPGDARDVAVTTTIAVPTAPSARPTPPQPVGMSIAPMTLLATVWTVLAVAGLARLAREAWRVRTLARTSTPLVDTRWLDALARMRARTRLGSTVHLRVGTPDAPVITWGVRRSCVLVPSSALAWPDDRVHHVLAHELAHVARRDWSVHLLLALAGAIYMWHPLMRLAVRAARREAERACDDAVLATGVTASAYATTLLDVARTSRAHSVVATPAMAEPSSLERRIAAMLDATLDHTSSPRRASAVGAGLVLALTTLVAGLSVHAQGTGTVTGTVLPTGGTPIANVAVTFSGASTVTATTDAQGHFTATLPGGTYRAEIRTPGFKRFSARVDVAPGATVTRDFALALGQVQESISVTGGGARPITERTREATGPAPTRPEGTLAPPLKLRDVKPQYDEALKAAGVTGAVVVEARIGADGYVTDTRVVSSPDERLSASAIEAIEQWKFAPTLLQGKPVATDMQVTITFAMK